jgi:hypothetical protein
MTKAELQAALDVSREAINDLRRRIEVAKQDMRDAEADLAKWESTGLSGWPAPNSAGEPFCIAGEQEDVGTMTYAVELYVVSGAIVGVVVTRQCAEGGIAAEAGLTPSDRD